MKYTKKDIEKLSGKVFRWASSNRCGHDFGVFYNGKLKSWDYDLNLHKYVKKTKYDVNPLEYCEYFSPKFVGGMWYDGNMYDIINGWGNKFEKLNNLLKEYGLYFEHCDSCHGEFVPIDSIDDYEYTDFFREKPIWLYRPDDAPDPAISRIMLRYYELAKQVGDVGACTIGEYIEFRYKEALYRMCPQTPYQGEMSWREPLPEIENLLKTVGATDIYVNYGRLD